MGGHGSDASRRREQVVLIGIAVLAVLLLGPALAPGYVLQNDLVFVPTQDLLPWMLGITGGLPRSVPQDAVVALLSGPVPGWVLEKVALLSALLLLGTGCARLARPRGAVASAVAGTAALWSAYVGERLLLGHWSLLLAVGALPWALHLARRARGGRRGAGAGWLLVVALASLTVSGGLLVLVCTAPVVVVRAPRSGLLRRWLLVGSGLVLQLPWAVPALLHPSTGVVDGADVFAARSEGPWGLLLTVLTGGGAWNASAVPASRTTWFALVLGTAVLVVAAYGARDVVPVLGRAAAVTLTATAVLGLVWCLLGGWALTRGWTTWVVTTVPGAGVLRDAQKWLAPWVVLVALAAGLGAARLRRRVMGGTGDRAAVAMLGIALVILPVVALPSLAWGEAGRLASVSYPSDLDRVRQALLTADDGRLAVSLPWGTFRRFPWNPGRTVLDPVPRAMPVSTVASDSLVVSTSHGLVTVPGDDPASARVQAAVDAGEPLGPVLAHLGVGWAVVADDLPSSHADLPAGAVPVVTGTSFSLFRLPAATEPTRPSTTTVTLVLLADALAVAVVLAGLVVTIRTRRGEAGANTLTDW